MMRGGRGRLRAALPVAGLLAALAAAPAFAHEDSAQDAREAPRFAIPAPGTYELPPLGRVQERRLLDSSGRRAPLLGLAPGQVAIVAFVYASCSDGQGCPAALATLQRFDRALAARPQLARRVRLVTVSFDPVRDTPAHMAALRKALRPKADWRFLTAASEREIRPVLADFGQTVQPLTGADGARNGVLRHVLKVFLVDAHARLRNIYSTGFLSSDLLLADVETLLGVKPEHS